MPSSTVKLTTAAALAALATGSAATTAAAAPERTAKRAVLGELLGKRDLYVLTRDGVLSRHDGLLPLIVERHTRIRGVAKGDRLIGLDTRPATGGLYALSAKGQLYTIDAHSGHARAVGAPLALDGKAVGLDFNPTVDLIRVVTDRGQNLRVRPATGELAGTDGRLAYAAGDASAGSAPQVAAAGYTDSVAGATSTALYDIDSARDALVRQGTAPGAMPAVSPNTGQLFSIGRLGLRVSAVNGFDIDGVAKHPGSFDPHDYRALAAVKVEHGTAKRYAGLGLGRHRARSLLVKVDLRNGHARPLLYLRDRVVGLTFAAR